MEQLLNCRMADVMSRIKVSFGKFHIARPTQKPLRNNEKLDSIKSTTTQLMHTVIARTKPRMSPEKREQKVRNTQPRSLRFGLIKITLRLLIANANPRNPSRTLLPKRCGRSSPVRLVDLSRILLFNRPMNKLWKLGASVDRLLDWPLAKKGQNRQ